MLKAVLIMGEVSCILNVEFRQIRPLKIQLSAHVILCPETEKRHHLPGLVMRLLLTDYTFGLHHPVNSPPVTKMETNNMLSMERTHTLHKGVLQNR